MAYALNEEFLELLASLLRTDARFLVVGAHAMAVHGVPRATGDMDPWIERSAENAERVWKALAGFGAPLESLGIWGHGQIVGERFSRDETHPAQLVGPFRACGVACLQG